MLEGTIVQNGCVQCQIYTGKHGVAERVHEWFKICLTVRKKSSMCIYVYGSFFLLFFFFFFFSRVLFGLKSLVVIGFTVVALYVEVDKECHRL